MKRGGWLAAVLILALSTLPAHRQGAAEALRARHQQLRAQLADNPFQRPLHLQSKQSAERLQGDIHAVLEPRAGMPAKGWIPGFTRGSRVSEKDPQT